MSVQRNKQREGTSGNFIKIFTHFPLLIFLLNEEKSVPLPQGRGHIKGNKYEIY